MTSAADMYTDLVWLTGSAEDPLWSEEYHEMVLKRGIVRELILHPGAGKTRYLIPKIAMDCVVNRRKLLLLAPTRVVAREMIEALRGNEVYPTIVLSNQKETGEHNGVTVMCHATWLHSVMESPNKASRPDLIIMDEAGVQQAETIALMKMYRGMAGAGGPSFLEMTATGTTCDSGSRFPIDEIGTTNPINVIRDYDFTGKKVLVFTPMISDVSGEAIVEALLKSWDPEVVVRVIRLNRKTMEIQCGLEEFSRISMMEYCFQRGHQAGTFLPSNVYSEIDWPYTLPGQDSVWRQKDSLIE